MSARIRSTLALLPWLAWLAMAASSAHACSCVETPEPRDALREAAAVFSGRVLSVPTDAPGAAHSDPAGIEFQVHSVWKGVSGFHATVHTSGNETSCGYQFVTGETYLVYAWTWEGVLQAGLCSRTNRLANAAVDLALLPPVHPSPSAPEDLTSLLADLAGPTRGRAIHACRALASRPGDAASSVPAMLRRLASSGESAERLEVLVALGHLGPAAAAAVPVVTAALSDSDPGVSLAAVEALMRIGPLPVSAITPLLALLGDEHETAALEERSDGRRHVDDRRAVHSRLNLLRVRRESILLALFANGSASRKMASAALVDGVRSHRVGNRLGRGLVRIGAGSEVARLLAAEMMTTAPGASPGCARMLATIGADAGSAVPALARELQVKVHDSCSIAARTLASIGPSAASAAPALLAAMDAGRLEEVEGAHALARIGSKEGVPRLARIARDSTDHFERDSARRTLEAMGIDPRGDEAAPSASSPTFSDR